MPRPRKFRNIKGRYNTLYYKPKGIRLSQLEQVDLTLDEVEAFRLVDAEEWGMQQAADSMNVSKPTLCRMVNSARKKIAVAICSGKAISIQSKKDFNYLNKINMPKLDGTGPEGKGPKTGRGMGKCETPVEDNESIRPGRGQGAGRGRGMGCRRNGQ